MTSRLRAYCMRQSKVRTWGLSSHETNDRGVPRADLLRILMAASVLRLRATES
jgi:hypothetical protein